MPDRRDPWKDARYAKAHAPKIFFAGQEDDGATRYETNCLHVGATTTSKATNTSTAATFDNNSTTTTEKTR